MDIKKLQEIIDSSQLSDTAKDLVQDLVPEANRPEIQEEILKIIDYEVKMSGLAAEEAEEVLDQLHTADKKMDAADKIEDERLDELSRDHEEKMAVAEADIRQSLQYKDNLVKAVSGEVTTPSAQAQNPGYGGQQYNSATQASYPTVPVIGEQTS